MEKLNATILIESTEHKSRVTATTMSTPSVKTESNIKVLTTSDYKAAAACLAEAFSDDVACIYFLECPDTTSWTAERKWDLHLKTFECAVYAHILTGLALGLPSSTTPGEFDAVALWMPPGKNMDDWYTLVRSGLWMLKWRYSVEGRSRFFDEFLPILHDTKAEIMKERDTNSWYLVYLGTREKARGNGYAGKLVRTVTDKADADRLACYLESTHHANLPLYNRLGFEFERTIKLKDENVTLDIMVREPKAGRKLLSGAK